VNLESTNTLIRQFKTSLCLQEVTAPGKPLWGGVDLGTANIVTAVVDEKGKPVAGMLTRSERNVRDGLVFDYMGTMNILKNQIDYLRQKGIELVSSAVAYPPGTVGRNRGSFGHILNGAGLEVCGLIDEPSAAAEVLGIEDGCVVDIGGGTTGISIIEGGSVVYTGDEPTGGYHLDLVIAGSLGVEIEEAEQLKNDPLRQMEVASMVLPVFQKMGSIVNDHIQSHNVKVIYLVGGTSSFPDADKIIAQETGIPVILPTDPLLVTPLGTALYAAKIAAKATQITTKAVRK